MDKNMMEIIMNPVRQRICQYLILHQAGTANEMKQEWNDIPVASLYRHIRILLDAGCTEVQSERKIRGTIEKTYVLAANPIGEPGQGDIESLIQSGLLSIMGSFQKYFAAEAADPQRDLLSLGTSTLLLTDEEFMELMQKIGSALNEVLSRQPGEGRKQRRLTIISSPREES